MAQWKDTAPEPADAMATIDHLRQRVRDLTELVSDTEDALTMALKERDALKACAEAAEAVVRFGVDLIEGDSFGSEWKKGCADFRRKARALPVPADLAKRVGGESVDCTPIAWLPTETVQWLKEYDGQACAKMTAAHNRPIKSDGGVPVYLRPALSPDPMDDPRVKALVEAMTLAANRLHRCSVDYDTGTLKFIEVGEWAQEARAALAAMKGGA